jgi:hypothetical protein
MIYLAASSIRMRSHTQSGKSRLLRNCDMGGVLKRRGRGAAAAAVSSIRRRFIRLSPPPSADFHHFTRLCTAHLSAYRRCSTHKCENMKIECICRLIAGKHHTHCAVGPFGGRYSTREIAENP